MKLDGCWNLSERVEEKVVTVSCGSCPLIVAKKHIGHIGVCWATAAKRTDLTLTVVGLYTGRFSSGERVCKMLTVNRYPRDCRSSDEIDEGGDVQLVMFHNQNRGLVLRLGNRWHKTGLTTTRRLK